MDDTPDGNGSGARPGAPDVDLDHEIVDLAAQAGVVSPAGSDACGRPEDVAVDDWERVVRVNLLGTAGRRVGTPPAARVRRSASFWSLRRW